MWAASLNLGDTFFALQVFVGLRLHMLWTLPLEENVTDIPWSKEIGY